MILFFSRHKYIWQSITFPVLAFLLVYFITPIEWDHYDGLEASLKAGVGSEFKIKETYMYSYWLITYAIVPLQQYFINTPIITLFTLLVYYLSYIFYTYACISKVPRQNHLLKALIIALLFLIILPAIAKLSKAGSSFIVTGLSLYAAAFYAPNAKTIKTKAAIIIISTLLFALGYLIRLESALGATLIVGLYTIIMKIKTPKSLLYTTPLLLSGLLFTLLIFNSMNKIPFLKATEPALYYLADGAYNPPIEDNHNTMDSLKIVAIKKFFLNDSEALTIEFINNAAAEKLSLESKQQINIAQKLNTAWHIAKPTVSHNYQYILISFILLFVAIFYSGINCLPLVLFNLLFWLITFSLAYLIKLEDRHYIYMSQLMVFCNIQFLLQLNTFNNIAPHPIGALLIITTSVITHQYFRLASKSNALQQELQIRNEVEQEIDSIAKGKYLLFDDAAIELYRSSIFNLRKFSGAKKLLFFDMGQMPIMPEYKAYLDETCNCNSRNLKAFLSWMIKHKDEIIIVSTPTRNNFISFYIETVTNHPIRFKPYNQKHLVQKVVHSTDPVNYYSITYNK